MNKLPPAVEKEFDEMFQRFYDDGGIVNDDTNTWYGLEDIKQFIADTLAQRDKYWIEKIRKHAQEVHWDERALQDIIKLLQEKEK